MKQIYLKFSMLLLCLVVGLSSAWADSVTFTYSDYNGEGTSSTGSSYTMNDKANVSVGDTKFWGNNSYAHFYASGETTVTPKNGVTITKVSINTTDVKYNGYQSNGKVTASSGTISAKSSDETIVEWTGSATSAFTISHSKQIRWTTITVTYTTSGGSTTTKKDFNPFTKESYTLTAGADGNISEFLNTTPEDYDGTITYGSSDYDVIVIDTDGSYLVGDEGTTTIFATANATSTYNAIYKEVTITISSGDTPDTPTSDNLVVTYNFNDKDAYPEGFPYAGKTTPTTTAERQTFSISGNDIIINAPNNYYINNYGTDASRGLFFGKSVASNSKPSDGTAYLAFPAKNGYKLVKVEVTTTSTTGKNNLNVFDTSWNEMSTSIQAPTSKETTCTFELSNSTANTEYRLTTKNSGNNMQFKTVSITYEPVSSPEQPTTGTITVSEKATNVTGTYWATYSNTRPIMVENQFIDSNGNYIAGISVFTVTANGDELSYNEVPTAEKDQLTYYVVPANTGVLVKYILKEGVDFNGSVPFIYAENQGVTPQEITNNLLHPSYQAMSEIEGDNLFYKLSLSDGVCGFYWGAEDGAAFTMKNQNAAYLALPKSSGVKSISLEDATTTIKSISASLDVNAPIYNVAGQRVNASTKGILIQNGKKFINK